MRSKWPAGSDRQRIELGHKVDHVRALKAPLLFSSRLYREGHGHENVLQRLPMPKALELLVEPLTEEKIKKVFGSVKTKSERGTMPSSYFSC